MAGGRQARFISRREFLGYVAASAALCGGRPILSFADRPSGKDDRIDPYSFADQNGLGPVIDAPVVERDYCPLHREKNLPSSVANSPEFHGAKEALKYAFLDEGRTWDDSYTISYTFQHYGFCDRSIHCQRLLKYCETTHEYLYDQIDGLVDVDLKWDHLGLHSECANRGHENFSARVGKHTYYVVRVSAVNGAGLIKDPYVVTASPVDRAINSTRVNPDYTPAGNDIFVIQGATSLLAPFSELIHLSTNAAALRYADELAPRFDTDDARQQARMLGEAVTEAAAILLASRFLRRQRKDQRLQAISHIAHNLSGRLALLPGAMAFMNKIGIQEALARYTDDPAGFKTALAQS